MNIKEVAKRAKVSTATVSRTINDSEKVKPGTAARVRKAIEELNFLSQHSRSHPGVGKKPHAGADHLRYHQSLFSPSW